MSPDDEELPNIPAFLKRLPDVKANPSEVVMVEDATAGPVASEVEAPVAPAPTKPPRAKAKPKAPKAKAKPPAKAKAKAKPAPKAKAKPLDAFGIRAGTIKSKAAAMYSKGKGATLAEVKKSLGSVQFNLIGELAGKGFRVERKEEKGPGGRNVTRYRLYQK